MEMPPPGPHRIPARWSVLSIDLMGKIRDLDPMGMGFLDAREPPLIPQMPTFQGAGDGDCELPSQKVRTLHPMMITIHLWTL